MGTVDGNKASLQDLLDAVPADRTVAFLPTHEFLILHDGERELGSIPLDCVTDVSLLDDSSVQKRYTVTRSLILGPLVLLFPKKTLREAYRLCIQWKDPKGDYNFTYIRIARRIMAEHTLNVLNRALIPEVRADLARKTVENKRQPHACHRPDGTVRSNVEVACPQAES